MLTTIFNLHALVLVFSTTGLAYYFAASKNAPVPIKVISTLISFSLATLFLCFFYIETGHPI